MKHAQMDCELLFNANGNVIVKYCNISVIPCLCYLWLLKIEIVLW